MSFISNPVRQAPENTGRHCRSLRRLPLGPSARAREWSRTLVSARQREPTSSSEQKISLRIVLQISAWHRSHRISYDTLRRSLASAGLRLDANVAAPKSWPRIWLLLRGARGTVVCLRGQERTLLDCADAPSLLPLW